MTRKRWGLALAAVWLILNGLFSITNFQIEAAPLVMGVLAIVAGALILWGINDPA